MNQPFGVSSTLHCPLRPRYLTNSGGEGWVGGAQGDVAGMGAGMEVLGCQHKQCSHAAAQQRTNAGWQAAGAPVSVSHLVLFIWMCCLH